MNEFEVPERQVVHAEDDTDGDLGGGMVGEATTLPMSSAAKAAARRRRERFDESGGFGFNIRPAA